MNLCTFDKTITMLTCLLVTVVGSRRAAAVSIQPGDIIITEFFEGLVKIDPVTGTRTNIGLVSSLSEHPLFEADGKLLVYEFGVLSRVNLTTETKTTLVPSISITDMALEPSGDLIYVNSDGVFRLDMTSLTSTLLYVETFFGPRSVAVKPSGDIVITEFFEGFWNVDPSGGSAAPIADSNTLSFPDHLLIEPSGNFLVLDFNNDIYRVHPATGVPTFLASTFESFPGDMVLESPNVLLMVGSDNVSRIDLTTGQETILATDTFFSVRGVAVATVPEPSTATFTALSVLGLTRVRRRHRQSTAINTSKRDD
jgi:hypothetical protein